MKNDTARDHRHWMELAIAEARKCRPQDPNRHPHVGVVVVDKNGEFLGSGHRSEFVEGEHAEYTVLERKLPADEVALAGATVYTTLEPCTERGPGKIACADRLWQRQVAKVFIGTLDPNKSVLGTGRKSLEDRGIEVDHFDDDLRKSLRELDQYFFRYHEALNREVPAPTPVVLDATLSEDEDAQAELRRQALRAYVQRAEVRLSTMHRIAGSFISGAGLLILLPLVYRDGLTVVFSVLSNVWASHPMYLFLYAYPCILPCLLPLCSLWLLLRDLTMFYFTANVPAGVLDDDESTRTFHPRFALTAIPFSDDEPSSIKDNIRKLQFDTQLKHFVLPRDADEKQWLLDLEGSEGKRMALPRDSPWLQGCNAGPDSDALRMAFGLSGAYDRKLSEEAAKTELSLIRHNLHLRRLLMRYMKALLIIITTSTIMFTLSSGLANIVEGNRTLVFVAALWLWSSVTSFVVRSPIRWAHLESYFRTSDITKDAHLTRFERIVAVMCVIAALLTSVLIIIELAHLLDPVDTTDQRPLFGVLCIITALGPAIAVTICMRSFGKWNARFLRWV